LTQPPSNQDSLSLNKYISETGICSRREADKMIEQGKVTINGKKAIKGNRVGEGDHVKLNGKPIRTKSKSKPKSIYLAFHKPIGIVCTTDPKERNNIISYINYPTRLFPIGRLDKPSEGLIFLTNDGDIVNKILRAGNKHEKEYIVTVDKTITDDFLKGMAAGVPILGTRTKKCHIEKLAKNRFKIVLVQGLNRQIRRMCEHFSYGVKKLVRVRIMHIKLSKLPVGKWRNLSTKEIQKLFSATESSEKTQHPIESKSKNRRHKKRD